MGVWQCCREGRQHWSMTTIDQLCRSVFRLWNPLPLSLVVGDQHIYTLYAAPLYHYMPLYSGTLCCHRLRRELARLLRRQPAPSPRGRGQAPSAPPPPAAPPRPATCPPPRPGGALPAAARSAARPSAAAGTRGTPAAPPPCPSARHGGTVVNSRHGAVWPVIELLHLCSLSDCL